MRLRSRFLAAALLSLAGAVPLSAPSAQTVHGVAFQPAALALRVGDTAVVKAHATGATGQRVTGAVTFTVGTRALAAVRIATGTARVIARDTGRAVLYATAGGVTAGLAVTVTPRVVPPPPPPPPDTARPAPAPAPVPVGLPVDTLPADRALVLRHLGLSTLPSVAAVEARGGPWAQYEQGFRWGAEHHWTNGGICCDSNFYDRALIYWVWWARTGHPAYRERAILYARQEAAWLRSLNWYPQPFKLQGDGIALDALVTGDTGAVSATLRLADALVNPRTYWSGILGDTTQVDMDSRTQARLLTAAVNALAVSRATGRPSPLGQDYAARVAALTGQILASQRADGAFRWRSQCYQSKAFMGGMVHEALIRAHAALPGDPVAARIPDAVTRGVDYLWRAHWDATAQAFRYLTAPCTFNGYHEDATPYADLNNMAVSGFAWVAARTADPAARAARWAQADALFASAVAGVWLPSSKAFNQQYTTSARYLALRWLP